MALFLFVSSNEAVSFHNYTPLPRSEHLPSSPLNNGPPHFPTSSSRGWLASTPLFFKVTILSNHHPQLLRLPPYNTPTFSFTLSIEDEYLTLFPLKTCGWGTIFPPSLHPYIKISREKETRHHPQLSLFVAAGLVDTLHDNIISPPRDGGYIRPALTQSQKLTTYDRLSISCAPIPPTPPPSVFFFLLFPV